MTFGPYQDLTYFLEVDSAGDIEITPDKCTVTTMSRGANSYVRKDFGNRYFGDFKHRFHWKMTGHSADRGLAMIWIVCTLNTSTTYATFYSNNDGLSLYFWYNYGSLDLILRDWSNDNRDTCSTWLENTDYYIEVERYGAIATAKIYTDANFSTILDTLTIVCVTTRYRYFFVTASRNQAGADTISYFTQNYRLTEKMSTLNLGMELGGWGEAGGRTWYTKK